MYTSMLTLVRQTRTFFAITRRNLYMILKQFPDICLDGGILAGLNVLLFAYLFPAMGMSSELVVPVFVGSLLSLFINLSFGLAVRVVFDLRFKRFIDYQLTLPLTTRWFFACQVTSFFLELFISTMPIVILSFWALSGLISFAQTSWVLLLVHYSLTLLFFSILFLAFGILYEYTWFLDNMWPRRLTPFIAFGCIYVPWFRVKSMSPMLSSLMLLNPLTYISEGMRSCLLGSHAYLAPSICLPVLIVVNVAAILLLAHAVHKKLNPV